MDCLLINFSNSSSAIFPCLLPTTRDFSCSSDASFRIKIDWMFVSSRTKNALHITQYKCCHKMTKTTTATCLTFFPDILYLNIIPRVCVGHKLHGYNHLISNKREWNNCFIKGTSSRFSACSLSKMLFFWRDMLYRLWKQYNHVIMLSKNQSAHSPGSHLINLGANSSKLINHGINPSGQQ